MGYRHTDEDTATATVLAETISATSMHMNVWSGVTVIGIKELLLALYTWKEFEGLMSAKKFSLSHLTEVNRVDVTENGCHVMSSPGVGVP